MNRIYATSSARGRYRAYVFTLNNPELSPKVFAKVFTKHEAFRYLVFQKEKCPNTGTEHYQGYIEWTKPIRITHMKALNNRMHFFRRKGSAQQAAKYCKKAESRIEGPWEYGEISYNAQGTRTDIEGLYDLAKSNLTLEEIADKMPSEYMRYYKAVDHCRAIKAKTSPGLRKHLKVSLYWGEPGTGKTRRAYDEDPELYSIPISQKGSVWFDNYTGQKTLLLDDFSGQMPLDQLNRILDIYPIQVPVKGSHVFLHCDRIIVTSNINFKDWYNYENRMGKFRCLERRFHEIIQFTEPIEFPPSDDDSLEDFPVVPDTPPTDNVEVDDSTIEDTQPLFNDTMETHFLKIAEAPPMMESLNSDSSDEDDEFIDKYNLKIPSVTQVYDSSE